MEANLEKHPLTHALSSLETLQTAAATKAVFVVTVLLVTTLSTGLVTPFTM